MNIELGALATLFAGACCVAGCGASWNAVRDEGAANGNGGSSGAASPAVRLVGRMDKSDPAGPRFAWSGSGVVARFSGTSVGVQLAGGQQYTVVIDGVLQPKLTPSGGVTPIADGLRAGEHTIEIYRRTEASQGESQFLGFELGSGALLEPPPAPERRLEVIGDSITCGYGNEGADMNCPFSPDTENHYLTYAASSARSLGAELVTIAWSGKGVLCNYGDDAASCTNPLPSFYDRILPNRPASLWDFSYQPHAVVINLGTNDFSTAQDPTQAEFEQAYAAFLERLRDAYPDAWILCTVAPMLSGADLSTARAGIANAVALRTSLGDTKVKAFQMAQMNAADGYGCDWHPSLATHDKMARELSAELSATLGW
jgi:lysophospholipase L1-like esterase